jgi:hypothetical protein
VRFDLALTNRLLNSELVPSTFPLPPSGVNQVVAFAFATDPAGLFGLKVLASTDWNGTGASGSGAPHNFFNDAICIVLTPPGDCFRWEAFGSTVSPGATTAARRVGFDVDPSVAAFTVYIVVAADVRERAAPALIHVSEASAIFTALPGGSSPSRQIQITNSGGGGLTGLAVSVTYQSGQPTGWLGATLSSTTAPAALTLQTSISGLAPGIYLATVALTSPDAGNSPLSIAVALILDEPLIAVSPKNVNFLGGVGGPSPPSQNVQISAGAIPISGLEVSVVYGPGASDWLTADLSGTTTPATLTLTADPGDLTATGDFFASVKVTSPAGESDPILVKLQVELLPDLTFTGTPSVSVTPGIVLVTNLGVTNLQSPVSPTGSGPFNVVACLSSSPSVTDCIPGLEAAVLRPSLAPLGFDAIPQLQILADPGTYYVFAVVDPPYTAMVVESDETNNVLALGTVEVP